MNHYDSTTIHSVTVAGTTPGQGRRVSMAGPVRRTGQPHRQPRGNALVAFVAAATVSCLIATGSVARAAPPANRAASSGDVRPARRMGEDWPRFLGPRDTGISGEQGLLEKWPASGPPVLWSKRVGTGYSAPSVMGNRLVLFHRWGHEEATECYTADTGEFVWRHAAATDFEDPYGYNNGPRCSPLLTPDRCYTFGAQGRLTCLELQSGKPVWTRDTAADFNIPPAFFGVGSTPILEGGRLIAMVGGQPDAGVVAFDAATGKTAWHNVGLKDWNDGGARYHRDDKLASYASPLPVTIHGQRQVLCFMRPGLISLDPANGRVLFSHFFRSVLRDSVNAARPVVVDDKIFLSAAYDVGAVLLHVAPDCRSVETVWRNEDCMQTHWSTSIYHGGFVYGFSGRHEPGSSLRCVDFNTGVVQWQTHDVNADDAPDPKAGLGATAPKFYGRGSAILADGKLIVLAERGTLALVELNPRKFVELARVKYPQMHYPSWTAPVLSHKRLYLRCEDHLLCLDLAQP